MNRPSSKKFLAWLRSLVASRLRINMVSTIVTNGLNILVLGLAYPVYLHFLGYDLYGVWLSLGVVLVFAQLGDLGIRTTIIKLVAETCGRKDWDAMAQYVIMSLLLLATSGTLILILVFFLQQPIIDLFRFPEGFLPMALWLFPWVGLLSVYVLIVQTLKAIIIGLGRMDLANYIETGGRVATIVLSVVFLLMGWQLESLLVSSFVSHCGQHLVTIRIIHRQSGLRIFRRVRLDTDQLRIMFGFTSKIFLGSLVSLFLDPFNRMMITRYIGVSAVPVYDIVYRVANQIRSLVAETMRPIFPELSRLAGMGGAATQIRHIQWRLLRIIAVLAPALAVLWWFSGDLFRLWLASGYSRDLPGTFGILLVGIWSNLLGVPAYYILLALDRAGICLGAHAIQAVASAILVLAAWQGMGTLDIYLVCMAVSCGYFLSSIFLVIHGEKMLQQRSIATIAT